MYTTCLFCHGDLGTNEVVEAFPVGRRLAFDAAKGRLWVVCRKCERWNLTPLEERWEAIEACERLFRDARLRASTDNVGMAKLREGLELVRIGAPQRPELAAWRYGDQFGRRRRRRVLVTAGGLAALSAIGVAGVSVAGATVIGGLASPLLTSALRLVFGRNDDVIARIPVGDKVVHVQRKDADDCVFFAASDGVPWGLKLPYGDESIILRGDEARRATALLMPGINRNGASARRVQAAVARLDATGGAERYVEELVRRAVSVPLIQGQPMPRRVGPSSIDAVERFALEMAVHEEQERRALEGELAELERAWQAAEEVAAIADGLFVDDDVNTKLERMKHGT